jgi:hypothetical protein
MSDPCGCGCVCGTHLTCSKRCDCPCHTLDDDSTENIARSLLAVLPVATCVEFATGLRSRLFIALRDDEKLYDAAFASFIKRNPAKAPKSKVIAKSKPKAKAKPKAKPKCMPKKDS